MSVDSPGICIIELKKCIAKINKNLATTKNKNEIARFLHSPRNSFVGVFFLVVASFVFVVGLVLLRCNQISTQY